MDPLAQRLLDAHVAFEVARLRGAEFAGSVSDEIDRALTDAEHLTLDDVMTRERIKAVAHKYVALLRLPGSIPEIAGDIVHRLHDHPIQDESTLGDIVARRHVEALVEKLAESPQLRARVVRRVAKSQVLRTWFAEMLYQAVSDTADSNRRLAERVPGVATALSIGDRVASTVTRGRASDEMALRTREYAERIAAFIMDRTGASLASSLTQEDIVEAVLEVWDDNAARPVRDGLDLVSQDDLEDLVAIVFEFWLDVRGNAYLEVLIDAGVDLFFDRYGSITLRELLDEFGLGPVDLVEEAMRFAPPIIDLLAERGLLDGLVRRRLAPFYESAGFAKVSGEQA